MSKSGRTSFRGWPFIPLVPPRFVSVSFTARYGTCGTMHPCGLKPWPGGHTTEDYLPGRLWFQYQDFCVAAILGHSAHLLCYS